MLSRVWAAVSGIFKNIKNVNKKRQLGVLGMQGAGKTRFWCHVRGTDYIEQQTHYDELPVFDVDGLIFHFSGEDIGGGKSHFKEFYKKTIKKSDFNMFLFDVREYFENKCYRDETNGRLEVLWKNKLFTKKPYAIVGTHVDMCNYSKENDIRIKVINTIDGKEYQRLLMKKLFYVVDMREKEKALKILTELTQK